MKALTLFQKLTPVSLNSLKNVFFFFLVLLFKLTNRKSVIIIHHQIGRNKFSGASGDVEVLAVIARRSIVTEMYPVSSEFAVRLGRRRPPEMNHHLLFETIS